MITDLLLDVKYQRLFTDFERKILMRLDRIEEMQAHILDELRKSHKTDEVVEETEGTFPKSQDLLEFKTFCKNIDAKGKKCVVSYLR